MFVGGFFFFFKQKTAYEMRISDWSSDVCSSDLIVTAYNDMLSAHQPYGRYPEQIKIFAREAGATAQVAGGVPAMCDGVTQGQAGKVGRASGRARGCQYV